MQNHTLEQQSQEYIELENRVKESSAQLLEKDALIREQDERLEELLKKDIEVWLFRTEQLFSQISSLKEDLKKAKQACATKDENSDFYKKRAQDSLQQTRELNSKIVALQQQTEEVHSEYLFRHYINFRARISQ